jgi:hypothetical protein
MLLLSGSFEETGYIFWLGISQSERSRTLGEKTYNVTYQFVVCVDDVS